MGVEEILKQKREEILRIAARHGAYNVRVFGSVARGNARPDSDVDLLVDVGPNRSFFFPGGLIFDLEQLLGRRVEVAEPAGLHSYLRERVLREAVTL
jgi:predicted nucleotidyltransferase